MTRPLRICMAMLGTSGGSSIVAQELGRGLMPDSKLHRLKGEQVFEVRYCHLRADQLQQNHFLVDDGPAAKTSKLLDIPQSLSGGMDAVSELLRIYDCWPFDILHLHNVQVFGLAAQMLKSLRGVPYIVTCHGSDVLNPHLFDRNKEVVASVLYSANAVTCVSHYLANVLRRELPELPAAKVINNFIGADWCKPTYRCQPQAQRFLHTSSMRAVKRPELLLEAFGRLQQKLPEAQLVIVSTAEGVKRTQALLQQGWHSGRGLDIIDSDCQPQQLASEYARAQAMVLTSQFEGFALVVLEALQHGLPVVAPKVGALPEVLGQDWPYLVAEQDRPLLVENLAKGMAQVAEGPNEHLQVRMQEILARYEGSQQIAEYAGLYCQVFATSNPHLSKQPLLCHHF